MNFNLSRFVFDVQPSFEINDFLSDLFDYSIYYNVNLTLKYKASRDGF